MKIAIVGGHTKADYLIGFLLDKNHTVVAINDDEEYCNYLADTYEIPIIIGDATDRSVLDDAHINGFDILIALTPRDADNLAICQLSKKLYNVKKAVCAVANPKNVEVFKKLGLSTVISTTYMVARYIEQASTIENLIQTLSIEDQKAFMTELLVDSAFPCVGKKLVDLHFPHHAIIGCIFRDGKMHVPNGQSIIAPGDKLFILSDPEDQNEALSIITGEKP